MCVSFFTFVGTAGQYAYGQLREQAKRDPTRHPVATPDVANMGVETGTDTKESSMSTEKPTKSERKALYSADAQPSASGPLLMEREQSPREALSSSGSTLVAVGLPASGDEQDTNPGSYVEVITTAMAMEEVAALASAVLDWKRHLVMEKVGMLM